MRIALLQLFWLSFVAIGAAEFKLYGEIFPVRSANLHAFLRETHWIVSAFTKLAAGMAVFILVVLPGCFFQWPIYVVMAFYLALLAASAAIILRGRRLKFRLPEPVITKRSLFLAITVGGVMVADYVSSLVVGGWVGGDAKFEIAQITLFAQQHLTLADPIFGSAGVPPTVYSTSILHALEALASRLFGMPAYLVWFYSYAFFKLIVWASLFTLAYEFLSKKLRSSWPYAVLVLLPFLYGSNSMQFELHNKIVIAWTALFIFSIKFWLERGSIVLLAISSIMIASAHPLNAFMAAAFLISFVVIALMLRQKLPPLKWLAPVVLVLLLPMALYFYYPHGITAAGFNDNPTIGPPIRLQHYGPLLINHIDLKISPIDLAVYLLVGLYILAARRIPYIKLRITILGLLLCCALLTYTPQLTGLIGYVFLIYLAKDKRLKILLALLVVYLGLIIYNPVLVPLLDGRIPLWVMSRFDGFNVLVNIAPVIGLLCISVLPLMSWGRKKAASGLAIALALVVAFVLPFIYPTNTTRAFDIKDQLNSQANLAAFKAIQQFRPQLAGQVVLSDDPDLPAMIPGAVVSNVLAIDNEANANPAVDISQRKACARRLVETLQPADLKVSGVTEILTSSAPGSDFAHLLRSRSHYVTLQKRTDGYSAYKVDVRQVLPNNYSGVCSVTKPGK